DTELDRAIVLREIARRHAQRGGTALLLLGQRYGVLGARPALDLEQLPLGPHALCRCLRDAGDALQLELSAQLLLYRQFERQVMERHGELVQRLGILLDRAGVLPGLVYAPYRATRANPAQRRVPRPPARATGRPMTGWPSQARAGGWGQALATLAPGQTTATTPASGVPAVPPLPGLAGAAGGAGVSGPAVSLAAAGAPAAGAAAPAGTAVSSLAPAPAPAGIPGAPGSLPPPLSPAMPGASDASAPAADAGTAPAGGFDPQAAFAALQGLVAGQRGARAAAPPSAPPVPLPAQAVGQVLGSLQSMPLQRARGQRRRTVEDVREAALARLRNEHGPGAV